MPREIRSGQDLSQAVQARLAEQVERSAARGDLQAQCAATLARLAGIEGKGGSYGAAEVRDAVVEIARILSRSLQYLRHL